MTLPSFGLLLVLTSTVSTAVIWKTLEDELEPSYRVIAPVHKFQVQRPSNEYYEKETKEMLSDLARNRYKVGKNVWSLKAEKVQKAEQILSSGEKDKSSPPETTETLEAQVEASTAGALGSSEVPNEAEIRGTTYGFGRYDADVTEVTAIGFPSDAHVPLLLSIIFPLSTDEVNTAVEAEAAVPGAVWQDLDTGVTVPVPEEPTTVRYSTVAVEKASTTRKRDIVVVFDESIAGYTGSVEVNSSRTSDDSNIAVLDESTAGYGDIAAKNSSTESEGDSMAVFDRNTNNDASKPEKKLAGIKDTGTQNESDYQSPRRPTLAHEIGAAAPVIITTADIAEQFGEGIPCAVSKTTCLSQMTPTQTRLSQPSTHDTLSNANAEYPGKMPVKPEDKKNATSIRRGSITAVQGAARTSETTQISKEMQKPPVRTDEYQLKTRVDLNGTGEEYFKEIPIIHGYTQVEKDASTRESTTLEQSRASGTRLTSGPSREFNKPTAVTAVYQLYAHTALNNANNEYVQVVPVSHDHGKLETNATTTATETTTREGSMTQSTTHAGGLPVEIQTSKEPQKPSVRTEVYQLRNRVDLRSTGEEYYKDITDFHNYTQGVENVSPTGSTTVGRSAATGMRATTEPSREPMKSSFIKAVYQFHKRTSFSDAKNGHVKQIPVSHARGRFGNNATIKRVRTTADERSAIPSTTPFSGLLVHTSRNKRLVMHHEASENTEIIDSHESRKGIKMFGAGVMLPKARALMTELRVVESGALDTAFENSQHLQEGEVYSNAKRKRQLHQPRSAQGLTYVQGTNIPLLQALQTKPIKKHRLKQRGTGKKSLDVSEDMSKGENALPLEDSKASSIEQTAGARGNDTDGSVLGQRADKETPLGSAKVAGVRNTLQEPVAQGQRYAKEAAETDGQTSSQGGRNERKDLESHTGNKRNVSNANFITDASDMELNTPVTESYLRCTVIGLGLEFDKAKPSQQNKGAFDVISEGLRARLVQGRLSAILPLTRDIKPEPGRENDKKTVASPVPRAFVEGHHQDETGLERRVISEEYQEGDERPPNDERDGRLQASGFVLDSQRSKDGEHKYKNGPARVARTRMEVITISNCSISKLERHLEVCHATYLEVELAVQEGFNDQGCRLFGSYTKCVYSLQIFSQCHVSTFGRAEEGRNYRKAKENLKSTCDKGLIGKFTALLHARNRELIVPDLGQMTTVQEVAYHSS